MRVHSHGESVILRKTRKHDRRILQHWVVRQVNRLNFIIARSWNCKDRPIRRLDFCHCCSVISGANLIMRDNEVGTVSSTFISEQKVDPFRSNEMPCSSVENAMSGGEYFIRANQASCASAACAVVDLSNRRPWVDPDVHPCAIAELHRLGRRGLEAGVVAGRRRLRGRRSRNHGGD